jgi:transcriptional regulator with XRE-family HTH domain
MCESLGARLRQRREEQGIALSTIAGQTKIKQSLLESLERDDVSRWPSGIFRRAFVRAYAHAIGLDSDTVVREFLDMHPDPLEEVTVEAVAAAIAESSSRVGPPTRLRYLVGAAVGSLSRFRSGNSASQKPVAHPDVAVPSGLAADIPEVFQPVAQLAEADDAPEIAETNEAYEAAEILEERANLEPAALEEAPREENPLMEAGSSAAGSDDEIEVVETVTQPAATLPFEPDLSAAAALCTALSRIEDRRDLAPLLEQLAQVLDAVGLVIWLWDPQAAELTPAFPYGYSDQVLAQLPNLPLNARNATAAAFRSAEICAVSGGDAGCDALVVPLVTPTGCGGVLALELQNGAAQRDSVAAVATILAAQLARVVGVVQPVAAIANRRRA